MGTHAGKKLGYAKPMVATLARGSREAPGTHADVELDRAMRALFYSTRDTKGRIPTKNLRNVARGATHPWRVLVKRFHDAKRARNPQQNYPLMKQAVRELDRYVDALFGQEITTTGEFTPIA